jgi:GR25 family glycosyltransferase involved in LPS biosynthesis
MKGKKFSVIIPTMWRSDNLTQMISKYLSSEYVGEIIIIDNDPKLKFELEENPKIIYYTANKNLFVNPSWNLGYSLSKYETILANDDIIIDDVDHILRLISDCDFDIIGVKLEKKINRTEIVEIHEFPHQSYGSFMYIRNYTYIPEQIKIWYGDNILFDKSVKKGLLLNSGIHSNSSSTVKEIKNSPLKLILEDDRKIYEKFTKNDEKFNIVIRTSGRENYFKYCIESIRKHYKDVKIHITIDDIKDLGYVEKYTSDMDTLIYVLNKKTVENIAKKEKINRQFFLYNYYFNIVRPFLKGWTFYLDDDDVLIKKPEFDNDDINVIHLYKTDVGDKIVPSVENFGKRIILNDINTRCVIVHSSKIVNWIPNRGGDHDFIKQLYETNKVKWYDDIFSVSQSGGNFGMRNDLNEDIINGFYLNLDKREDRRNQMEKMLSKTKHNIIRFQAIDGDELNSFGDFKGTIKGSENKQYATYLSHLKMLEESKKNGWDKVLILEDDITIANDFDKRLSYQLGFLPEDWKIIYLGFNGQPDTNLDKVNKWVYEVKNVFGCFGMLINGNFLEELIDIIKTNNVAIDEIIRTNVLPKYKCYSFIPFLLYVNDDYSDLWNKHRVLDRIKNFYVDKLEINNEYDVNLTYPFGVTLRNQLVNDKVIKVKNDTPKEIKGVTISKTTEVKDKKINYEKINIIFMKNNIRLNKKEYKSENIYIKQKTNTLTLNKITKLKGKK